MNWDWLSAAVASEHVRRFSKWLLFSLLASLAPFWIAMICSGVAGIPFYGWELLANGELLLICFGLAATGTGDIFANRRSLLNIRPIIRRDRIDTAALYCTWALMVVVVVTAVSYAALLMSNAYGHDVNRLFMGIWSAGLLLLTMVSASVAASIGR